MSVTIMLPVNTSPRLKRILSPAFKLDFKEFNLLKVWNGVDSDVPLFESLPREEK